MAEIRIAQVMGKWLGGGVESVVMNYYRNLDRSKIQFDFICDSDSKCIPYEEIEAMGGKVILVPPYQKIFAYRKTLKSVLKKGGYKIIHSHISTMSVFPLQVAKSAGVEVRIAHSHSTSNKKEFVKNLMKKILRHFSKIFATDYMACSRMAACFQFGKKTFGAGKVYVLNNAIDVKKFTYSAAKRKEIRKELNVGEKTFVIGHLGRFVTQKNHCFLIDVFEEVKKLHEDSLLLLAGEGPLMENIRQLAKEKKLEDSIMFLNQRSDADFLYSAMDAFVLPSLYEGLPVVGVEAQCADLNCYFSDQMTLETKVLEKTKFLSLKQSPEEWARMIVEDMGSKRKKNALVIKEKGFDIHEESSRLENFYLQKSQSPSV